MVDRGNRPTLPSPYRGDAQQEKRSARIAFDSSLDQQCLVTITLIQSRLDDWTVPSGFLQEAAASCAGELTCSLSPEQLPLAARRQFQCMGMTSECHGRAARKDVERGGPDGVKGIRRNEVQGSAGGKNGLESILSGTNAFFDQPLASAISRPISLSKVLSLPKE